MKLGAREVTQATGGWVGKLGHAQAEGVSIDTRTLAPGDLFVALRGPRFDGHAFLREAVAAGAAGLVIAEGAELPSEGWASAERDEGLFIVRVPDTLRALGDLAAGQRRRLTAKVVTITGSNGKTTAKEMTAAILGVRWTTAKSPGNFNNLVGVPLSIFAAGEASQALVLEAGMNHPGEIGRLTDIAYPDVGIITSIAPAHLEHLKDINGVREAKAELLDRMKTNAVAVLNADDPQVMSLAARFKGRVMGYGLHQGLNLRAERIVVRVDGGTSFDLVYGGGRNRVGTNFLGLHNVYNAMAAAAAAVVLGFSPEEIREGLSRCRPLPMRLEPILLPRGIRIVNDAYNANPGSVRAAVETVQSQIVRGERYVLLGDMLELGEHSREAHEEIGSWMARRGVAMLVTVGNEADAAARAFQETAGAWQRSRHFSSQEEAAAFLARELKPGDMLLVKGSRAIGLEKAVQLLREPLEAMPAGGEAA